MNYLDKFTAVLTPARADDLAPGVTEWVGKTVLVQYVGEVDHQCAYIGQPRFDILTPGTPMCWAPGCDLADLQPVGS